MKAIIKNIFLLFALCLLVVACKSTQNSAPIGTVTTTVTSLNKGEVTTQHKARKAADTISVSSGSYTVYTDRAKVERKKEEASNETVAENATQAPKTTSEDAYKDWQSKMESELPLSEKKATTPPSTTKTNATDNKPVAKSKADPVYRPQTKVETDLKSHTQSHPDLNAYSLVVGSFATQDSAERLQEKLSNDGVSTVIVFFDAANRHRVIAGSYSTIREVKEQASVLVGQYVRKYSEKERLSKYGIKFEDAWLLINR